MNILRLIAELGLDTSPFKKGMDVAKLSARQSAIDIGSVFKETFAKYLGAAAIIGMLHKIVSEIDNIQDSSKRLDISTDAFQRFSVAASRAGQSLEGNRGIGRVFNEIAELRGKAEGGDLQATVKLNELGLSMLGAADNAETMESAFLKVINLTDSKLAEVFGGKILLDIKAYREELERVGNAAIYTAEQIRNIKAASESNEDALRTLMVTLGGLTNIMLKWNVKFLEKVMPHKAAVFLAKQLGVPAGEDVPFKAEPAAGGAMTPENRQKLEERGALLREKIAFMQQQMLGGGGGASFRDIISASSGRGVGAALIGSAGIRQQERKINPELKKLLEGYQTTLDDIEDALGRGIWLNFP